MLVRLKGSVEAGLDKLRWLASLLNERLKVEMAVVKLLWKSRELEKDRDALLRGMGQRVFELRGRVDANLLGDSRIRKDLAALEKLEAEIKDLKGKVSEIGKVEGP